MANARVWEERVEKILFNASEFSVLHLAYKLWSQSWVYLLLGERRREGFFLLYMPTVAQFYFRVRYKYSLERQMSPCLPTTLS